MKIPRKLGLSFLVINASAALVMAIFLANIMMIDRSTEVSNFSQSIYAKALTLETSILRQNSQFRGFLVTGDESYLKSYGEGRVDFDDATRELKQLLKDPEKLALVRESDKAARAWRRDWGDRMIALVRSGQREEAQAAVRAAGPKVLVSAVALPLRALRAAETEEIESASARQESAIRTALITLAIGTIVLIGIAISLSRLLTRQIARPITQLTAAMTDLAAGRHDVQIVGAERGDELGDMASAVVVFRNAAVAKVDDDRDRETAMTAIGGGLRRLSGADLTARISDVPEAFEALSEDFNQATGNLSRVLADVRTGIGTINHVSVQISEASDDLSERSERQAASLQESAASLDEITKSVHEGATATIAATTAMAETRSEAERGGAIVRDAIGAMNGIEQASNEIAEIISLIDGIAFQTNLLALNAGVEAARAGDAGRGFAVVASEVRALAQRSAHAATEVKTRVQTASTQVRSGVALVDQTGQALNRIIDCATSVSEVIEGLARSSDDQAKSLGQINIAISDMDSMTQQNAAMVEETSAATRKLVFETEQLAAAIGKFAVDDHAPGRGGSRAGSRPPRLSTHRGWSADDAAHARLSA